MGYPVRRWTPDCVVTAKRTARLADRSHRPHDHPGQLVAEVAARVCELRRTHPRWEIAGRSMSWAGW